ncbi:hypothetical protein Tcan_00229 [Toxocara canis]|uniref:Uncharacterized protein n=1 Tax=Toxocara canis TaxID=6265 RepID=A0A0B2VN82_TOXCA|nr:hypothetical protein Tcan_00229 [Toxocara canis]
MIRSVKVLCFTAMFSFVRVINFLASRMHLRVRVHRFVRQESGVCRRGHTPTHLASVLLIRCVYWLPTPPSLQRSVHLSTIKFLSKLMLIRREGVSRRTVRGSAQ